MWLLSIKSEKVLRTKSLTDASTFIKIRHICGRHNSCSVSRLKLWRSRIRKISQKYCHMNLRCMLATTTMLDLQGTHFVTHTHTHTHYVTQHSLFVVGTRVPQRLLSVCQRERAREENRASARGIHVASLHPCQFGCFGRSRVQSKSAPICTTACRERSAEKG